MTREIPSTPPTPRPQAKPPAAPPPAAPGATGPKAAGDRAAVSKDAAAARAAQDNELHEFWESYVVDPLKTSTDYWAEMGKEGGAKGVAGKVMGGLLSLSGLPSIAKNASAALDSRQSLKERLKRGGFAVGELALNFIPIGKIGGVGARVFRLTGGAKVIQRLRNATKLGAEVRAGTKIMHYTTKEAAEKIATSGVLKGSERGFLSMAGKGEHLAVTAKGLKKRVLNNGQVYAVAADGKTSKLGSVIDAVVGVGADTRLGKILGKVSPPKTNYGAVVEHALTAEEAARSVRWGKTIVTNVPPHMQGLAVKAGQVRALAGQGAGAAAKAVKNQSVDMGALGKVLTPALRHKDLLGYAYVKTLIAANRAGEP